MREFECMVCGYVYDEAKGYPEIGILPGTKWEDIPADFVCPMCATSKSAFRAVEEP